MPWTSEHTKWGSVALTGQSFAGNAVIEQINALIEQRCALSIRRLTDPAAENDVTAEPSV